VSLEQLLYAAKGGAESISEGGISRRAFLKASAAAGGGLLLSFRLPALMRNAEAAETPTANTFAPNAFIRIDRQGRVTLIVHQVEMGQGTYTSLPMLLAEELEVDLAQVQLEHAPPDGLPSTTLGYISGCDPSRVLSSTGAKPGEDSEVTFELTPRGADVIMVLTHRRLADRDAMVSITSGWHTHVGLLTDILNGHELSGFWSTDAVEG
jgi:hypothetical protein